jgi:hypothetical protein
MQINNGNVLNIAREAREIYDAVDGGQKPTVTVLYLIASAFVQDFNVATCVCLSVCLSVCAGSVAATRLR